MDALRVGPFVLPMQVALLLASILLAQAVAAWFRRARGVDAGPLLWKMLLAGLVAGRVVFVLRHWDLYWGQFAATPWSMIDVRDGGIDALAAFATAFIVGAELSQGARVLRRPLLTSTMAGCALFFGGAALNTLGSAVGAPLPAITVRQLDGATVPLNSFGGRPLVVNLWATWCPPCRREMPVLRAAQQAHPELAFVFVNQGESAAVVQAYLASQGLVMANVVLDPVRELSTRTGSAGYPTTLFYDAKGHLAARRMGELSQATLADQLGHIAPQR